MNDATERWLPVRGYEGIYEVSDLGRVRSLPRVDARGHQVTLKFLKPVWNVTYFVVTLSRNGAQKNRRIHTLVTEAFYGPRSDGMEVCHNNGDARDNRLSNLRYGTSMDNGGDKVAHQTHCKHGHAFTPENTYQHKDKQGYVRRHCVQCRKRNMDKFLRKTRAA